MADEVIIIEMKKPREGEKSSVAGDIVTTQVLDIAAQSAQFNAATEVIVIQSKGVGFWAKIGDSTVSAAADTDGNFWVPADTKSDPYPITGLKYLDTAADA